MTDLYYEVVKRKASELQRGSAKMDREPKSWDTCLDEATDQIDVLSRGELLTLIGEALEETKEETQNEGLITDYEEKVRLLFKENAELTESMEDALYRAEWAEGEMLSWEDRAIKAERRVEHLERVIENAITEANSAFYRNVEMKDRLEAIIQGLEEG